MLYEEGGLQTTLEDSKGQREFVPPLGYWDECIGPTSLDADILQGW